MFQMKNWSGSNTITLALPPIESGDLYQHTVSYLCDVAAHQEHLAYLNYELLIEDSQCNLSFDPTWQAMIRTMMDVWCSDTDRIRDRLSKPAFIQEHDMVLELSVGLRNSSPFFTLWCDEGPEIMHALLIGKLVLNSLRELIPTFTYTYAHHTGNGLLINEREEIAGWMCGAGSYHYLYTEGISEGISLDLFAADDTSNVSEFLAVLYQILSGLIVAYERYKFTHNALHLPGTIIVRPIVFSAVPLYGISPDTYITCSHLAQIRDYRYASAQWHGHTLGSHTRVGPFLDMYILCNAVADTLLHRARATKRMSDISRSKYIILRDIAGYCVVPEDLIIDHDLWQITGCSYWKQPSTIFAHGQKLTLSGLIHSHKHLQISLHSKITEDIIPTQYIKTVNRFYLRYRSPLEEIGGRQGHSTHYRLLSVSEYCDISDQDLSNNFDLHEIETRAYDIVQSIYHNLLFPVIEELSLPYFFQDEEYYAAQAFALALFGEKLSYICALERHLTQARMRKNLPLRPMFASVISKLRSHLHKQLSIVATNVNILREAGVGLPQYDRLSGLEM